MNRMPPTMLILLVACAPVLAADEPPVVTAVKTPTSPKIDGVLDDAVWQKGEWYNDFTMLGETDRRPAAQTRFKVAFTASRLFFAIDCDEPNMDALKEIVTKRDGKVHHDDCVEIMIDSTGDRTEYYHLTVNVAGTLYDAWRRQAGHVHTSRWDCNWRAKIAKAEDSWTAEAAVPFVELGLTGASRGNWALNVARERRAGAKELSSFTPATGGFHQPAHYAALKLPDADIRRFMWTIRDPFEAAVHSIDGRLVYSARTHITNETGRFWFGQLRPALIAGDETSYGEPVNDGYDDGQGREVSFTVPVRRQGRQILRLKLVDRRDPERVLYVKSIPVDLEYTPLAIDITRPCYRDCIYATQNIDTIQFTVNSALTEDQLTDKQLTVVLRKSGADGDAEAGEVIARSGPIEAAASVQMTLPADNLDTGDYLLTVQLASADGTTAHTAEKTLRKLPPSPSGHEWRIDANNVLLHNGEPYLPFGWFSYRWADHGPDDPYTAMQDYNANWRSVQEQRGLMDGIADRGLFVTFYPYCRDFMNRGDVLQRPLNDDEASILGRRVAALMDHPALMAWYMADEPELRPVLPRRAEQIYQVVRDTDPYHPCIMLNDTIKGIHTYAGGGDILMPDPYPCFLEGGLAARPIEKVSAFIDAVREATGGDKPAWVTPQAFDYGAYGRAGNRAPNFTELRNELYQAVVHGAKGFLWYTHGQAQNYPELGIGMRFLGREIQDLKAAVLAEDLPDAVSVEAPQPDHIHACARRADGQLFVMAVNTATEPQDVELTVPAAPDHLWVVSEGRRVSLDDHVINDHFDIYATHIYTTDEALAERRRLTDVIDRIDKANAARKKPGNIAFEDSGVEVTVSSGARYGNTPDNVVDGIETHMGWKAERGAKGRQWLRLDWPEPVNPARVVVYSTTVAECLIQVPAEGEDEWEAIATASGPETLQATFAAVRTRTLRLKVTQLQEDTTSAAIQEVEVYAE